MVAVLLEADGCEITGREEDEHGRPQGPALLGVPDPLAEHVDEAGAEQEDRKHLPKVGEWGGVLIRVGGVGVHEPAPVSSQLLDGLLGGYRSLRDRLCPALQRVHKRVRAEVLRHTLPDQEEGEDKQDG